LNGFSPLWNLKWILRCPFLLKRLSHCPHAKGLSPLWTRKWVSKALFFLKPLPHSGHAYGLISDMVDFGQKFGMSTNLMYVNACVGRSRDQIMPVKNLVPIDKSNGGVTLLGVDPGISS